MYMDVKKFIDTIIREVAYRTDSGTVDLKDKRHISILSEVLIENDMLEIKDELIRNLLGEADDKKFDNPDLNKVVSYTDANGEKKEGIVGNLLRQPKDTPPRDAAERALGNDERKIQQALQDLGYENAPEGDSTPGDGLGGDGGEQQGTAFKGKRGDSYRESLPETDPAIKKPKRDEPKNPAFVSTNETEPSKGEISDVDDEYSDGSIKQKGLNIGYNEKGGFKPAPGNASSMLNEIMSGEVFHYLEIDPNMDEDKLFEKVHEQIEDTTLGIQNGSKKRTKTGLLDATYRKTLNATIKSGIVKFRETQKGIALLSSEDKLSEPVKSRNFYGHEESIKQQIKLMESLNGPIYTKRGIEVPKDTIINLIKESGGGENPSDTSTITIDKQGRALITFHSDKISTSDIQANSTPKKESTQAKKMIRNLQNMDDMTKNDVMNIIDDGQSKLEEKERELKSAANGPALQMANGDISRILKDIKNDTGINSKATTSSHLEKSIMARGAPHPNIRKYLPEIDGNYTEEELLKAFYEYMGDDNKEKEPSASQLKLLYRSAKQNGYDISATLSNIRQESLEIQRQTYNKLNERSYTLPSGKQIPMGDYVEGMNLIEKLHLNIMDGEQNERGVGKYPGLFNLNMGGVLVESKELKECMNVDDTNDFIEHFEVGKPGDGEEMTKNNDTGAVTGRNLFVFAITKQGKRIPIAFKTQRSKQGQSGKLATTYQWDTGMQKCFASK